MRCIHHLGGADWRQKATGVHDLNASDARLLVRVDSSGVVTVAHSPSPARAHSRASSATSGALAVASGSPHCNQRGCRPRSEHS